MTTNCLRRATISQLLESIGALAHGPRESTRYCLVVDADRTLAPQDTGRLVGRATELDAIIRVIFEQCDYTEDAFQRVAATWGTLTVERYLAAIALTADAVTLHAAWAEILGGTGNDRLPGVIVTAGIPEVWRIVLKRDGLGHLPVVGGCHPGLDSYFVCSETKCELVELLQSIGWKVIAAGDSRIDLPMLQRADLPIFVPDSKGSPALRRLLHLLPATRHLIVDDQRFDGVPACTSAQLMEYAVGKGWRDAH